MPQVPRLPHFRGSHILGSGQDACAFHAQQKARIENKPKKCGRLAQLVRAPALQAGGRRFEPCTAHQIPNKNDVFWTPRRSARVLVYLWYTGGHPTMPLGQVSRYPLNPDFGNNDGRTS